MTIPGPRSGRVQRWKEIPEAMKKKDKDDKYKERGGKEDNKRNIEGNEKLKRERMHAVKTKNGEEDGRQSSENNLFFKSVCAVKAVSKKHDGIKTRWKLLSTEACQK